MEVKQVLELLKTINGAYNRFTIKEDMPVVWYEFLKSYDYELIRKNLTTHIKTSNREPAICDLIRTADSLDNRMRLQQEAELREQYSHPSNL